ncbi:MAG: GAF domain-containing protein [Caldilineaceae bacterium]
MQTLTKRDYEYIRQLVQAAPIAVVVIDSSGKIIISNPKLEEMFGYEAGMLTGQPLEILVPAQYHQRHAKHRSDFFANPHTREMGLGLDLMGQHRDGHVFPVEIGLGYLQLDGIHVVMATAYDLSPRKSTEAFLEARVRERTQELERRRQVADGLRGILALINSNATLDEVLNQIVSQAVYLLNADAGAIYQLNSRDGMLRIRQSFEIDQTHAAHNDVDLSENTPISQAVRQRQPTTTLRAADSNHSTPLREDGFEAMISAPLIVKEEVYGSLVLYYKTKYTFSEEALSLMSTYCDQAALAVENARLYTQIEQTAVAAERNRIAHDLHDSVTQTLFSASMIADILPRLWERNREDAVRRLQELRELTRGALAEMRTLLLELRPTALNNVSLTDLLQQLADAVIGRSRVPVQVEIQGEAELDATTRVAFYRIAQEALNNVAKHAEATHATLVLTMSPDQTDLLIQDNGRGFVVGQVSGKCLGLSIMRERADEIGARLTIRSQPSQGTVVHVSWHRSE